MRRYRGPRRPAAVLIIAMLGCTAGAQATPSLTDLAKGWSGGRDNPVCQKSGPHGEYLDPLMGEEYCQWPTLSQGDNWGVVGGHRMSTRGFLDILWERRVASVGVVNYLVDSLGKEFHRMGMTEVDCPSIGRRWESSQLSVIFMRGQPLAGGAYKISVMAAVSAPKESANRMCPGTARR